MEPNKYQTYKCKGRLYFCFKESQEVKFTSGISKVRMVSLLDKKTATSARIYFDKKLIYGELNVCELEYLPSQIIRNLVRRSHPIFLDFSCEMPIGIFIPLLAGESS